MTHIDIHTENEPEAPAFSDPVNALLFASFCVTTLLFALTEQYAQATAALVAYAVAWGFVRRA